MRISDWSSDVCSSDLLLKYMRMLQRDTIVDHRVGCAYNGRVYLPTWFPTDKDYVGDFAVLEVDMPRFNRDIPWEYTTPANGRSYCWTAGAYLDQDVWIDNFVRSACGDGNYLRSEEHTSELHSLMPISYAVFCLKKKIRQYNDDNTMSKSPLTL